MHVEVILQIFATWMGIKTQLLTTMQTDVGIGQEDDDDDNDGIIDVYDICPRRHKGGFQHHKTMRIETKCSDTDTDNDALRWSDG